MVLIFPLCSLGSECHFIIHFVLPDRPAPPFALSRMWVVLTYFHLLSWFVPLSVFSSLWVPLSLTFAVLICPTPMFFREWVSLAYFPFLSWLSPSASQSVSAPYSLAWFLSSSNLPLLYAFQFVSVPCSFLFNVLTCHFPWNLQFVCAPLSPPFSILTCPITV